MDLNVKEEKNKKIKTVDVFGNEFKSPCWTQTTEKSPCDKAPPTPCYNAKIKDKTYMCNVHGKYVINPKPHK
jgi:hypothetical protein